MEINTVLLSVGLSSLVVVVLRLVPLPSAAGSQANTNAHFRNLESRYTELERVYEQLRDDYSSKLVEYTNAYHEWTHRESGYQQRINLLEARVGQLQARIKELEERAKITPPVGHDPPIIVGVWPDVGLDIKGERDASYNAGYEHRALDGDLATKSNTIKEIDDHGDRKIIIEIGAHGTPEGTNLYDDIAKPGWWRRILTGRSIELVLLLSCESDEIARALHGIDGINDVISVQRQIIDSETVVFAGALYRNLARGDVMRQAVENAKLHVSSETGGMIKLW